MCGDDPYEMEVNDFKEEGYPNVTTMDIIQYLVLGTCTLTLQQYKAFKACEAHNYVTSGWIKFVRAKTMCNGTVVVIGKVNHSQSINETPLRVWVLCQKSGEVITAHCVCMAGLGAVCSHVGAILHWLELVFERRSAACTSKDNAWLPPGVASVPITEARECDFSSAKMKFKRMQEDSSAAVRKRRSTVREKKDVEATNEEVMELLAKFEEIQIDSAALRVFPGFCDSRAVPDVDTFASISYEALFDISTKDWNIDQLRSHCATLFESFQVTDEEVKKVEIATRKQSKNPLWKTLRTCRITASVIRQACHSDPLKPSITLLKKICYPGQVSGTTWQMERGSRLEGAVLQQYEEIMKKGHINFQVVKGGLFLCTEHPHIGASPDGLTFCSCHGEGLVEVKCPATDVESDSHKCLSYDHQYYYQIQTQLFVIKKPHCDFVVYYPSKKIHIQRIFPDVPKQEEIVMKSKAFFFKAVLPEMVGRYFSSQKHLLEERGNLNQVISSVCKCKQPPKVPMINCAALTCQIVTYHWHCVGVTKLRKRWKCQDCEK